MEICIENLSGKNVEKLTPKMVRRLLGIDNKEIAELCRQISLVPKKDAKGQTYFSREDVDVLKKIKQFHTETHFQEVSNNVVDYPTRFVQNVTPMYQEHADSELTTQGLISAFSGIEKKIIGKISQVIDEKLEGMDEVVVELIRCKTENEALRQKNNALNKEVYKLKDEVQSYKPVGFGLYVKQKTSFT